MAVSATTKNKRVKSDRKKNTNMVRLEARSAVTQYWSTHDITSIDNSFIALASVCAFFCSSFYLANRVDRRSGGTFLCVEFFAFLIV